MSAYPTSTKAFDRIPPVAATAVTAGNGASSAAIDLSALKGRWVTLKAPGKTHFRFGPSGVAAAATTDWYLAADEERDFFLAEGYEYVRAWGVGGAHACVVVPSSR